MSANSGTMDSGEPVVDVLVRGEVPAGLEPCLVQVARQALGALGLSHVELSVVLCDDAIIAPLNAQWRGASGSTDVLSFPQDESADLNWPSEARRGPPRPLGDLVISVQTARRQALELGHDLSTELSVLLVHGLLHLLGFDHETSAEDAALMRAEEARLLGAIGGGAGLVERAGSNPR